MTHQSLTKKTKRAIALYTAIAVYIIDKDNYYLIIQKALEADRMPREKLFEYLDKQGYTWDRVLQGWRKKGKRIKNPNSWQTKDLSFFNQND